MATVNPKRKPAQAAEASAPPPLTAPPRRRRWPWLVLFAVFALLGWFWPTIMGYARTGASVGARVGCSCRYVAGRSLSACRDDFEKGMGLVVLSEDKEAKSVTARFPLLSTQTATFHEGWGCVLEKWDD